jgi:type I restriction enzyme, S subunit
MSTQSETALTPKLRFPEYTDDWEKKNIISISEKLNVGFVGTCEKHYINKDNGIMLIRTGNLVNGSIQYNNLKYVTPEFHFKNKKSQVKMGDILIARHGSNGQACIYDSYDEANTLNIVILRVDKLTNPEFLINQINSPFIKKQILSKTAGSTQGVINTKEIGKLKVLTTTLLEQNKIAVFIKAVDNKIEQLSKKQELLEKYKKGLMQKIFSQEIRFKADDGSDYPDWEDKKINKVFKFKQGVQCSIENQCLKQQDNQVRFIRIIDLTSDNEPIRYIDDPGSNHHIIEDDLFMVRYGAAGLIGYGYKGVIANNLFRYIPVEPIITCNKFYYFLLDYIKPKFEKLSGSSTIPALNFKSINKILLSNPCMKEQAKIANFLSLIDNKIEQVNKQLDETKQFKKALLQQMFV